MEVAYAAFNRCTFIHLYQMFHNYLLTITSGSMRWSLTQRYHRPSVHHQHVTWHTLTKTASSKSSDWSCHLWLQKVTVLTKCSCSEKDFAYIEAWACEGREECFNSHKMSEHNLAGMLCPLADSGDNNVLMQSIQDYNQSLFEFICLILLLFFTKMEARVQASNRVKVKI